MQSRHSGAGFTLVELLVVLAIISILLTLASPRYFHGIDKAQDGVLREDLYTLRKTIDQFYADNGHYPNQLSDLVTMHYLRQIPPDPITGSAQTWVIVPPANPSLGSVYDVKSGATGDGLDGTPYSTW